MAILYLEWNIATIIPQVGIKVGPNRAWGYSSREVIYDMGPRNSSHLGQSIIFPIFSFMDC